METRLVGDGEMLSDYYIIIYSGENKLERSAHIILDTGRTEAEKKMIVFCWSD